MYKYTNTHAHKYTNTGNNYVIRSIVGGYQQSGRGWHHSGLPQPPFLPLFFLPMEGEGGEGGEGGEKRFLIGLLPGLPIRLIYRGVIWLLHLLLRLLQQSKKLLEYKMVTNALRRTR